MCLLQCPIILLRFLEKQKFLFTSFNLKEAMRLSSTHVMKMTWKQTNRVRRHLGEKIFSTVAKSVSGSQCLCSTKFVFLSQEHTDIHNTPNMTFYTKKIISEEKIIISTLDKYCAFIIVNFILYFNKCTSRLRADSLSLNCILVVREKTNTAYFYPLRKAEASISTYYRKRGSASYIVREWLLWESERERERRLWRHRYHADIASDHAYHYLDGA